MPPRYVIYPGTELERAVFRVVGNNPPKEDDFLAYAFAARSYPAKDFFRATGVSMFLTKKAAERGQAKWGLGNYIAELDLRADDLVLWSKTGGYDHITVWAPPAVLLTYLVNCT